jgi:hypothetical protein
MIRLVGPGGAGKSTVGALLAKRLELAFLSVVLLPSLDRESCVTETVRRQIARPFGRSSAKEEAVIRARFETYMALPARKIETMRPVSTVVDRIVAALSLEKRPQPTSDSNRGTKSGMSRRLRQRSSSPRTGSTCAGTPRRQARAGSKPSPLMNNTSVTKAT